MKFQPEFIIIFQQFGSWIQVTGVNATLDNLLPGALYEIKVRAKGSKGVGPYSYPQSWQVENAGDYRVTSHNTASRSRHR